MSITPQAVQKLLDEFEKSRDSRKRAWDNLQEIRWVLRDAAGATSNSSCKLRRISGVNSVSRSPALRRARIPKMRTAQPVLQAAQEGLRVLAVKRFTVTLTRIGVPVAEAARQVGYESPSQFSREFKRLFGGTPKEIGRRSRSSLFAF